MYQVIVMHGDNEPWWFFDDWRSDIVAECFFETFAEAKNYYKNEWQKLRPDFSFMNARHNFLCAFWNEGEERWCEECDEYLQQYHGLALLEDYGPVTEESGEEFYETANSSGKTKCCKRYKQSAGSE